MPRPTTWAGRLEVLHDHAPGGGRFTWALYEQSSGKLVAIIEAGRLGQLRTGATTGVAAQWLAAPEAAELGLFGTGYQARTQLEALVAVRPIKRAFVYSRNESHREAFADEMSARLKDRDRSGGSAAGGGGGSADRHHGHERRRAGLRWPLAGRGGAGGRGSAPTG